MQFFTTLFRAIGLLFSVFNQKNDKDTDSFAFNPRDELYLKTIQEDEENRQ